MIKIMNPADLWDGRDEEEIAGLDGRSFYVSKPESEVEDVCDEADTDEDAFDLDDDDDDDDDLGDEEEDEDDDVD